MINEPKYPVETVIKAVEILNYLAQLPGNRGVGISELSHEFKIGKSTIHRVVDTLRYYGYVDQNIYTNKYCLGWKLYSIGQCAFMQNQLSDSAQNQLLEDLH